MRFRRVDPYTVPVCAMPAADRFNDALTARQRAHFHRRLARQLSGFESRAHDFIAAEAYSAARDFVRYARNAKRNWQ
jgi:hypothetical protein